ncbi:MAG: YjgN family protein, partial [Cellvibrionaceae bacterium]|nr:YjgN family protein [Cellvibrionaceae bacterium]
MSENLTAPAHSTQQAYQPDDWNSLAFHGSGREYFGIWIVNLILTLITVGIYSAWATVRNRRYFYGNTELDGARFDFHATGLQILVGRVIAVVLLIVVTISAQISSLAPLVAMLLAAPLLPYLITSAFRFRRRHTSYRNIRFGFDGNTWAATKAFGVIIVAGALIIGTFFSLVFAQPDDSAMGGLAITAMVMVFFFVLFIVFLPALFIQAVQQFSMSYSRFGSLKFNGSIGIRETVLAYFLAGLYTNLILLGAALLFGTA